jgi:hypothetical protein
VRLRTVVTAAAIALIAALLLTAQNYKGPVPPKPDLPYIVHGNDLLATDVSDAREETRKDWKIYVIQGAGAKARTPLAGPVLLFQSERIPVDRLKLYPFEVKSGQREVAFHAKKLKESARPARLNITKLGETLFRIEVVDTLATGQYGISPDGSNQVYCFEVF